MPPYTNRYIVAHFVWTILVAAILFPNNAHLFRFVILFNAGFATAMAAIRHEPFGARKITFWDEAVAFLGVFASANLLH